VICRLQPTVIQADNWCNAFFSALKASIILVVISGAIFYSGNGKIKVIDSPSASSISTSNPLGTIARLAAV
jgi:hypothetical protein